MAANIRLKRSAVSGRIPQTTDLELGEIAINTYDGRMYIKRNVGGEESVVTLSSESNLFKRYSFIATAGQTEFTGTDEFSNALDISNGFSNVSLNDELLIADTDYTVSADGLTLTLTVAAEADDNIQINYFDQIAFNGKFTADQLKLRGMPEGLSWDDSVKTIRMQMDADTHVHIGQDQLRKVYNPTASTLPRGTAVSIIGVNAGEPSVAPYIADGTYLPGQIGGVITSDIPSGSFGFATTFGCVEDFDTSAYPVGSFLYASATTAGAFVTTPPTAPDLKIIIGLCTISDATAGKIIIRPEFFPLATDVTYDNTTSGLTASNLQGAIDELQNNKASVDLLSSNITLFPTTAASTEVANHNRLVIAKDDTDYDTAAVDVATGAIAETETMIGQLASDTGLVEGSISGITVTLIGNIEKTSGNSNKGASFFFRMYRRESSGTEHLIGESFHTPVVYETDGYEQFSASVYLTNTGQSIFSLTDRFVLRFYGISVADTPEYNFQFGGDAPIRGVVPVPVSVIPSRSAEETPVDVTNFTGHLDNTDTTVQAALDTLDDHGHSIAEVTGLQVALDGKASTTGYNNLQWDVAYSWGDHAQAGYATTTSLNSEVVTINNTITTLSDSIAGQVQEATDQAGIATAQAVIATSKATESSPSAAVYTDVQESLVTMASNIISTQAIVVEHHAFS